MPGKDGGDWRADSLDDLEPVMKCVVQVYGSSVWSENTSMKNYSCQVPFICQILF